MSPNSIQVNRQILGTTNTFPAFDDEEGVFDWATAQVVIKVFQQVNGACCNGVQEVQAAEWTSDEPDALLLITDQGFSFTDFPITLPIGKYHASVQLTTGHMGSMALFRMVFEVANT